MTMAVASSIPPPPWLLYRKGQRWVFIAVLFLVSASNYFDRNVISVLLEPLKREFEVSDTMLGLLSGFSFAIFFSVLGLPVALWADRGNRRTIITLALTVWSVMTVVCGLAQTFSQLALARVGVGAGESGAVAPAQSLIVDYFPPGQRAIAIGILSSASTAGYLLGIGAGGYVAALYGWRSAFLLAGLPGLALALVVRLTLAEPRLQLGFRRPGAPAESAKDALTNLWRKRSFLYALIGCVLFLLLPYGAFLFIPSFLVRLLHVPLAKASATYGVVTAVASIIGTLGGGWLADRVGRQDQRWFAWLPAIACILTAPLFMLAFSVTGFRNFLALAFVANTMMLGGMPIVWAAIHSVCGGRRRAVAVSIVLFSTTLLSGGFGPLLTGALSDALTAKYGPDALRYSLMLMTTLLVPGGVAFYAFGRAMPRDLEE
jgi:predicted MFS family arabinose efflux permease